MLNATLRTRAVRLRGSSPALRRGGFTTIELVLVIVIIAVLSAIAAPRFFDNDVFSERAYFDEVASALRYAQKVAVASGCRVRVILGTGSYTLTQQAPSGGHCDTGDTGFGQAIGLGDGTLMTGTASSGITLAPPITIEYNAIGSTNLGANQTIAVGGWSLVIDAESGLVVMP